MPPWFERLRKVGFWRGRGEDPNLPDPRSYQDPAWDSVERSKVIRYLMTGRFVTAYMGSSRCRFCGQTNGSTELTDGVWLWPDGFAHYLEEHDVKPPQEVS